MKWSLIFCASMSNWGCCSNCSGECNHTRWEIYDGGLAIEYATYDPISDGFFDRSKEIKPIVVRREGMLPEKEFAELLRILKDEFPRCSGRRDACDGTGWEMRSYMDDGKFQHEIEGYIYGVKPLTRLANILLKAELQPTEPELWLRVNHRSFVKVKAKRRAWESFAVSDGRIPYSVKLFHSVQEFDADMLAYERLRIIGIPMPKRIEADRERLCVLQEYVYGDSIYDCVRGNWQSPPRTAEYREQYLDQMRALSEKLRAAGLNINYLPSNFVGRFREGICYMSCECCDYTPEYSFENWGIRYWSRTPELKAYERQRVD